MAGKGGRTRRASAADLTISGTTIGPGTRKTTTTTRVLPSNIAIALRGAD